MSLGNAIATALSGLRASQFGVALVADNIANAETTGYVRKSSLQAATAAGAGGGVRVVGVQREIDLFVQRQLRAELAGAAYADSVAGYLGRVETVYGRPGGVNSLDTLFSNFTNSLQSLATSPEASAARNYALNEAAVLAQHLNAMSADIQVLRSEAETALASAVRRINQILAGIETVSSRITGADPSGAETAALLDQRDTLIAELSAFLDIRTVETAAGQVSIFTTAGVSLFDHKAARLSFDGRDQLDAHSHWSADPELRNVGTIRLTSPQGYEVDLIESKAIRSGTLAAHLQMRDETLVQAQAQLDEIAHSLALALSNRTVEGTAVAGPPDGFALDLAELRNGNTISLRYTDHVAGRQHRVTIVRVDDAAALPLGDDFTADPGDTVIGVSFANGMGGVLAQLNAAFAATGLAFDSPAGHVLRVVDDGAPGLWSVDGLGAEVTTAGFASGHPSMPFFVDGGSGTLYTNAAFAGGRQKTGFAARIALNPALKADPSRLVLYGPGTAAGDPMRPDFLEQRLTAASRLFSAATGIGSAARPYSGTLVDFVRQAISLQGANAENAERLKEGQDVVLTALQTRYNDKAAVNVDREMAHLLVLQTAYGANARVLTAVKEMLEALMRM